MFGYSTRYLSAKTGLVVLLVICIALGVMLRLRVTSSPEYAVSRVDDAIAKGNLTLCENYLTENGKRLLHHGLRNQSDQQLPPSVMLFKRRVGEEMYLRFVGPSEEGPVTADFIMRKEGMRWRFHDIYIITCGSLNINMKGSYIIDHPIKANVVTAMQSPRFMILAFLEGYISARASRK
jgi:hypothetical protein